MGEKVRQKFVDYIFSLMEERGFRYYPEEVERETGINPETILRYFRSPLFRRCTVQKGTFLFWVPNFIRGRVPVKFADYYLHKINYGVPSKKILNAMIGLFTSPYTDEVQSLKGPQFNESRIAVARKNLSSAINGSIQRTNNHKNIDSIKIPIEKIYQNTIENENKYRTGKASGKGGEAKPVKKSRAYKGHRKIRGELRKTLI